MLLFSALVWWFLPVERGIPLSQLAGRRWKEARAQQWLGPRSANPLYQLDVIVIYLLFIGHCSFFVTQLFFVVHSFWFCVYFFLFFWCATGWDHEHKVWQKSNTHSHTFVYKTNGHENDRRQTNRLMPWEEKRTNFISSCVPARTIGIESRPFGILTDDTINLAESAQYPNPLSQLEGWRNCFVVATTHYEYWASKSLLLLAECEQISGPDSSSQPPLTICSTCTCSKRRHKKSRHNVHFMVDYYYWY